LYTGNMSVVYIHSVLHNIQLNVYKNRLEGATTKLTTFVYETKLAESLISNS